MTAKAKPIRWSSDRRPRLITIRQSVTLIAEVFGLEAVTVKQARSRLNDLDHAAGGRILRTLTGRRGFGCKLLVDVEALRQHIERVSKRQDGSDSRMRADIEGLARGVRKLRHDHKNLASEVAVFRNRQENINRATSRAIAAVRELTDIVANDES